MIPANNTIRLIDICSDENFINVLNNYPIYDNNYREILNQKIIDHYYYDEIGFETPFLFCHYLKVRLQEIMPKFNKLYESNLLKLDPLSNFSYKETMDKENNTTGTSKNTNNITTDSTSTNTGSSSSNSTNTENATGSKTNTEDTNDSKITTINYKKVFQEAPQGELLTQSITNYSYATNHTFDYTHNQEKDTRDSTLTESSKKDVTNTINDTTENSSNNTLKSTNNSTINSNDTSNSIENYLKSIIGNRNITTTKLLNEFVTNFIDIDKLIIDELYDLFLQNVYF